MGSLECTKCGATLDSPPRAFDFIRCADCGAIGRLPDSVLALRALASPLVLENGEAQAAHDSAARGAESDERFLQEVEAWITSARDARRRGAAGPLQIELLERVRTLARSGNRREAMELLLRNAESVKSWVRKSAVWFSFAICGMAAATACYYLVHPRHEGHAAAAILFFLFVVPGAVVGVVHLLIWRYKGVYKEPS